MSDETLPRVEAGEWVAVKDHAIIAINDDPEAMVRELDYRGIQGYEVLDCAETAVVW